MYKDLEKFKLADSLAMFMELAGADDPTVGQVLDGKSPRACAAALVDAAIREALKSVYGAHAVADELGR